MTNSFSSTQKQKLDFLRNNLPVYAKNYNKIRPKKGGFLIPLIYNEAQMMVHNFIENMIRSNQLVRVVICKGRQQGVSTYMASRYLHKAALNFGVSVFILAHMTDSTNYLFDMVKRMYNNLPPPLQPQTERSNRKELRFAASNSEYALGTAGSKEIGRGTNPTHLHGSEAAFWDNTDELAAGLMQAVATELGTEIVLESTANGVGNMFYNLAMTGLDPNALSRFRTLFIPWYIQKEYQETPPASYTFHITREEEELMQKYPLTKSHLFWRRRKIEDDFKGRVEKFKQEYPMCLQEAFQTTGDKLLTLSLIETARKYNQGHDLYAPLILGVDGAGQGADQTAWVLRQGRRIVDWRVYDEPVMPMRLAGIIAGLIDSYKIDMTFLDTAYGFGCRDRLQEMGYGAKTMAIHFGSEALMPELYRNKRAQMYGFMKDWFEDGGVNIPDDEIFVRDLLMIPGFKISGSRGLLILPPKEEIRANNEGRSPNCADALALTFAFPIQARAQRSNLATASPDVVRARSPFKSRRLAQTHVRPSRPSEIYVGPSHGQQ